MKPIIHNPILLTQKLIIMKTIKDFQIAAIETATTREIQGGRLP